MVGSSSSDGSKPLILTLLVSYHDQRCLLCSTGRKVLPLASQIADPWRAARPSPDAQAMATIAAGIGRREGALCPLWLPSS